MKTSYKKLLALLLCAAMLFALLPAFAAAEDDSAIELPEIEDAEPADDEPTEEPAEVEPASDEQEEDDTELSNAPAKAANAVVVLDEELVPGTNYFEIEEPYTIYYRPV